MKPPTHVASGRYEIRDRIGAGGMAAVYRAWDQLANEERAVKILLPTAATSDKARLRFRREAETMAGLDHPSIVKVWDVGEDDGFVWFSMALALGSLSTLVRTRGALPMRDILVYAWQVLEALEHAHARGVVHRDVKPHNMLLSPKRRVLLTDFGIARQVSLGEAGRITGTGDMLGTLAYMAPEQRLDPRGAGPAADIYSVGAVIYNLATARRPLDIALAVVDPTVFQRLPIELRELVDKATQLDPEHRYPSAKKMILEVQRIWDTLPPSE